MTTITPEVDAAYAARFPNWGRYDTQLRLWIIAGDDNAPEAQLAADEMIEDEPVSTASDKQLAFITKLAAERGVAVVFVADKAAASREIERLLAMPKVVRLVAPQADLTAGIYRRADGTLVRVYLGQNRGVMLAKAVTLYTDGVSYDYLGKASRFVTIDQRLALEEVGQLGIASGTCLCCGRRLDDPESVDRGVGPICAQKY